ncbi:MAG: hypothetical protein GF334_13165 [Candidatus Altiarchaeales archaeon]|nr:hypothetical protein [Candidatus Altiarchaeales archaeon]
MFVFPKRNPMKFIVASDIHGRIELAADLMQAARENNVEHVFLLGDYSHGFQDPVQNKKDVEKLMDLLGRLDYHMILGNCDNQETAQTLGTHNLHKKTINRSGISFTGFGASNPTPFHTAWELSEQEIRRQLRNLPPTSTQSEVFLTHAPAYGTKCDLTSGGVHAGSRSLREYVLNRKPTVMFSGHIHEAAGCEDLLGGTKVYAAGRLDAGYLLVDFKDSFNVEYERL